MNQEWKLVPHVLNSDIEQIIGFIADGVYDDEETAWAMLLAAVPVPTAGGVQFVGYPPVPEDRRLPPASPAPTVHRYRVVKMLSEDGNKIDYKPHGPWVVMADVHDNHLTRLQAEIAALQQRLTIADQRVDDLQHQQSQSLEVNPHSLRVVLTALVGASHEIRELQACRGLPDNPIDQLLREYNAWIETPAPATPQ